jgi:hypothetical protein
MPLARISQRCLKKPLDPAIYRRISEIDPILLAMPSAARKVLNFRIQAESVPTLVKSTRPNGSILPRQTLVNLGDSASQKGKQLHCNLPAR